MLPSATRERHPVERAYRAVRDGESLHLEDVGVHSAGVFGSEVAATSSPR